MLISIAFIFLFGLVFAKIAEKIHIPGLFGMILAGILIGPFGLNLLDDSILNISAELRKIALIIILMRAGLSLNLNDLYKIGRPAILMCFLPACFEIIGVVLLAPKLLGVTVSEAALIGATIAAVSPAVIVPKMIQLLEKGYGVSKGIPQLILAGASVDDVFVIVLFTAFIGLVKGTKITAASFYNIPISLVTGIFVGLAIGLLLTEFWKKFKMGNTKKLMLIFSIGFIMTYVEDIIPIPFASLLAIMFLGIGIKRGDEELSLELGRSVSQLWIVGEVVLFVLVGVTVNLKFAIAAGFAPVLLILVALIFRVTGVALSCLGTNFTTKEKIFTMIAYTPKATVQAAIGGIPLAMGLACGNMALTVAVLSILITAPLGAFLIEKTYQKFLVIEEGFHEYLA
ncbi:MAG: cation:proton antiporter [Tissierellia bacterium]|nr:cation:proton antiporter [Tissierellia bacterium]